MEQNLTPQLQLHSLVYLKYTQDAIEGGEASFKFSMEIIKMAYDNSLCLKSPTHMASIQTLDIFKGIYIKL